MINNIFPQNPQVKQYNYCLYQNSSVLFFKHGIEKNYLEQLRVYAAMKPQKLERSFRYMSEKIVGYLRNHDHE